VVTPGQYTDNFLHTIYPDPGTIGDLATRDHVAMMLLTHDKALGKITSYPFKLQGGQGHAARRVDSQFITSQGTGLLAAQGGRSVVGEWLVTNGDYTDTVVIRDKDSEEGDASNEASYLRNVVMETDGLIEEFGEVFETYLMSFGGGVAAGAGVRQPKSLARVTQAGIGAVGVLTLDTPEDAHNFQIGMAIIAIEETDATIVLGSASNGTAGGSVHWVIAVDTELGTITTGLTQGASTPGVTATAWDGATNAIQVFRYGDYANYTSGSPVAAVTNNSGSQTGVYVIDGFQDWITPTSQPGSKFNVTRNVDSRLTGVRLSTAKSVGSIENRILQLGTEIQITSGNKGPLKVIINSRQWTKLVGELKSRGITPHESTVKGATTSFGYSAIYVDLPQGRSEVIPSPHIQATLCIMLNMKSWHFCATKGMFPRVMNGDGLRLLRKATSDDYEFRTTCYAHLACQYPSWNGRATLAAV
jgi:hypothetical protein